MGYPFGVTKDGAVRRLSAIMDRESVSDIVRVAATAPGPVPHVD